MACAASRRPLRASLLRASVSRRAFSSEPAVASDSAARRLRGLRFEAQVVALLRAFACDLRPTQASNDGGIDHQGVWRLPDRDVEVVTQCKNERSAVGVQALREFHGVLSFQPPGALGVFASASGYSVFAQRYFLRMPHAAVLCTVEGERLASFLLNERAQTLLPKLTVASLFVAHDHELVLTYGDRILGEAGGGDA
ncbi:hypothetical protein PybrP1_011553 [[Pythium] brassicae (nom. inval.)]|nr:hypothetical protein PybrP1_011553 [[Pythium] brassicae (nom. inval.)]